MRQMPPSSSSYVLTFGLERTHPSGFRRSLASDRPSAMVLASAKLRFYPDGVVYGIGYVLPAAGSGTDSTHWLVTETALQWPRGSRNPRYRLLHQ